MVKAYYGLRRGGSGCRPVKTATEAEKILRGGYGVTSVKLEDCQGELVGQRWKGRDDHGRERWLWSFDPDYFKDAP